MDIAVTDLDYMVGLGHPVDDVREALRITKGNRNAALYILVKGENRQKQLAWRKHSPHDWANGISDNLPNIPENRALHISPVYVFVGCHWPTDDGKDHLFNLKVTMKDGREWTLSKTYTDFSNFKSSLPFGSCMHLKNSLPYSAAASLQFGELSKAFLDKRQAGLAEWIRELVLDEWCMTNPKVLDAIYTFIEADAHGGRITSTSSPRVSARPSTAAALSPLLQDAKNSFIEKAEKRKQAYYSSVQLLDMGVLPLPFPLVAEMLPFKVQARKLRCFQDLMEYKSVKLVKALSEESASAPDGLSIDDEIDLNQLRKDFLRDRIIIQGQRLEGSHTKLESVFDICVNGICEVITKSGRSLDLAVRVETTREKASPVKPSVSEVSNAEPTTPVRMVEETLETVTASETTPNDTTLTAEDNQQDAPDAPSTPESVMPVPAPPSQDESTQGTICLPPAADIHAPYISDKPTVCLPPQEISSVPAIGNPFADADEEYTNPASCSHSAEAATSLRESCEALSKRVLHQLSRTESAYLSHAGLQELLDIGNQRGAPDFQPFLFVPESALAEPLQLTFSILERNTKAVNAQSKFARAESAPDEWCVECRGETSTVYRQLDAETMVPMLQLRVTFLLTIFGMPVTRTVGGGSPGGESVVTALSMKEGKCQLVVDKVTQTTSRDWGEKL